jgi:hypothetical protein
MSWLIGSIKKLLDTIEITYNDKGKITSPLTAQALEKLFIAGDRVKKYLVVSKELEFIGRQQVYSSISFFTEMPLIVDKDFEANEWEYKSLGYSVPVVYIGGK